MWTVSNHFFGHRGISNVIYIRRLGALSTSLMARLEQTRGLFVTDHRDRVFAFLRQNDTLVPDFSKCLKDMLLGCGCGSRVHSCDLVFM